MKQSINNWKLWLMASLTLGLAPFLPEPHLFGKIRWIMGGAVGMKPMDWFDGSSSHLVKVEVWVVILKNGLCLPFAFRARLRTT
ncbi:hypothetical protein [Runella sp.]|uniref:hypothetical protein n=1 Tax=Runella sp. TaxID=1960881 RepID=UPI002631135F|nr:hypothetical protein [Runella sp.]